ncbi:MAG: hypothetical protein IPK00_13355 [Deltaproteobacteria bacterium]|nr:hypothetical protein [Deltaproteobacteria bacterium]
MNGWSKIAVSLLVGALVGFLLGRTTAGDGGPRAATSEAMASALRSAFVESDPMVRARDMNRLIEQIDGENLSGAIEVFREFATKAETLGVSELFARWSRIDVEGLAEAMKSWPDERARSQGIGWVAYQYAFEGGTAKAVPYYDELDPRLRLVTGYRLVEGAINQGDRAGLVEWIGSLDEAAERSRLTQSIVFKLLREREAKDVIAFFDEVPADAPKQYKRQAFLIVLDKLVRHDAPTALAFREARSSQPWAENSLSQLVAAWADVDPTGALAWIGTQPLGPERELALETLVDRWSAHDMKAAIAWTKDQLPSPMVDRLCAQFVSGMTISDPEQAMELATRIVDPTSKQQTLRAFARYWFLRRPAETRTWLEQGGLSPQEAEAMISELTQTRAKRLGAS